MSTSGVEGALTKCAGIVSLLSAVREVAGAQGYEAMVAALPPETAAIARRPPIEVGWLPVTHAYEIIRTAFEAALGESIDRLAAVARAQLVGDLNGIYRFFMKLASPHYVVERGFKLWDAYYRNNGTVAVQKVSDNAVEVRYEGLVGASALFWEFQRGAILGILEVTHVVEPKAVVVTNSMTDSACLIRVSWS